PALLDARGVAPERGAMALEDRNLLPELVDRTAEVPALRVLRDQAQQHLLAAAADHDRRMRLLQGLGIAPGALDPVVAAVELRALVAPHAQADLQRFGELPQARSDRREVVAVGAILVFVPPGAETELEAALAHVIERARHLGQQRW